MSFSQMQRSLQVMEEDMCFYSGVTGTVESLPMRGVSRHVNNIKSEGTYTNDSPTLIGNNINNESCVAIYNQVFSGFDPSRPTKYSRANISDSVPVLDMDQVKRGFFTVNSAEHNQGSKTSDDFLASLPDPPDVLFNCFSLGDLKGELPAQSKPGVCRLGSEISDDSSLDGGLPASSTVSSTSDGLVTGEDHEDDVYVDGSSSVEPPSMKNFTLNSPRLAQRSNIAIPSTCSEGSPQSTDQVRSCSLDAPLAELESGFVNQTILETATVVEQPSPAATLPLQLQGDGNIVLVQQDAKENERPQSSGMDLKWKPEASGLRQSPTVDLKWMHEPPVLVGDENLSKKLKSSPPSSPTTPTQPTLPALPFMRPNLGSLAMNVNPSNQSCSPAFLSHSSILPNSNQWLQQSSHPSPAVAKFAAPPGTKGAFIENMTHPLALFGANFPAVLNIDTASIENSRPKRRNVKISKDPQSVAARHRRERISDRIRVLQRLVPGGTKMDTASMLDEAISYVKYLKLQVQTLESCGNAGYDPRMPFPAYYLPVRPVQGDCSTMSQMAPSAAADHGMYGAGLGQSTMKFPDAYREQFCH